MQPAQCVLLFLVLAVNSTQFRMLHAFIQVARSYALLGVLIPMYSCGIV